MANHLSVFSNLGGVYNGNFPICNADYFTGARGDPAGGIWRDQVLSLPGP